MSQMTSADIIVIGGGVSGLSCAYEIKKRASELNVLVLESSDRLGGRTLRQELKTADGRDYFDLGGQWVGRTQPEVCALMAELGLETYPQYHEGRKVLQLRDGAIKTYPKTVPSLSLVDNACLYRSLSLLENMSREVPVEDPMSCPRAREWDGQTLGHFISRHIPSQNARDVTDAAMRTVFGVDLDQLSLLFALFYVACAGGVEPLIEAGSGGGQEFKVKGGAGQISELLAERLGHGACLLSRRVVSLYQTEEKVTVRTDNGDEFEAGRVVLAVPPHLIEKLEIVPALPGRRRFLLQQAYIGNTIKFIITYKTTWWRSKGFSGEVLSVGPTKQDGTITPLTIAFDATSHGGSPALVGFLAGRQAMEWTDKDPDTRRQAILECLCATLGDEAAHYIEFAEKDWSKEGGVGGCPTSMVAPGAMSHFAQGLRQPVGRLHWAGTETAVRWAGFINGAVQAGTRAAHEVLYHVAPGKVSEVEVKQTYVHYDFRRSPRGVSEGWGWWRVASVVGGALVLALALPRLKFAADIVKTINKY